MCGTGSPSVLSSSTPSSTSLDHYFTCSLLSLRLQDLLDFLTSILLEGKKIESSRRELLCSPSSYFSHCICFPLVSLDDLVGFLCEAKPSTVFLIASLLSSAQFSRSVVSDTLRSHELQHARPPCPSPTPGVHSDSCPSSQ